MKKLTWTSFIVNRNLTYLAVIIIGIAIAAGISMIGCDGDGGGNTLFEGRLHGEWFGSLRDGNGENKASIKGSIIHSASSDLFGVMSIDNEHYMLSGTYDNGTIQATLRSESSTITWNGEYLAGRIQGTSTRTSSSGEEGEADTLSLGSLLTYRV